MNICNTKYTSRLELVDARLVIGLLLLSFFVGDDFLIKDFCVLDLEGRSFELNPCHDECIHTN